MSNLIDRAKLLDLRKSYTKITGNVLYSLQNTQVDADQLNDWHTSNCNFTKDLIDCVNALDDNPNIVDYKEQILYCAQELVGFVLYGGDLNADYYDRLSDKLAELQKYAQEILGNISDDINVTSADNSERQKQELRIKSRNKLAALCDNDRNLLNILNSIIAQLHGWMDEAEQVADILIVQDSFPAYANLKIKYQAVGDDQTKVHSYANVFGPFHNPVNVLDKDGSYLIGESKRAVSFKKAKSGGIIAKSVLFDQAHNVGNQPKLILQGNLDELRMLCYQGLNLIDRNIDFDRASSCLKNFRLVHENGFFLSMLNMQYDISVVNQNPLDSNMRMLSQYKNQYLVYNKLLFYVDQSGDAIELGKWKFSECDLDNENKVLFATFAEYKEFKKLIQAKFEDDFPAQPKVIPNKNILQTLDKQKNYGLLNAKQHKRFVEIFREVELANEHGRKNDNSLLRLQPRNRDSIPIELP